MGYKCISGDFMETLAGHPVEAKEVKQKALSMPLRGIGISLAPLAQSC